jgi:hypothetical protein
MLSFDGGHVSPTSIIFFKLPGVSKAKMFEFAGLDFNEFVSNPGKVSETWDDIPSLDRIIRFFDADTPVKFNAYFTTSSYR